VSVLTINLRHLYQRRGLWLAYPMLALFVWVSIAVPLDDVPKAGEGQFIGLIVFAFMVGMAAMVLQMETLSKPMSFCLPGHRPCVRKVVFIIGLVTNASSSLLFLSYPGLPFVWRLLVLCSAFFAGLIFYLAGAMLAFRCRQAYAFVGLLAVMMFAGPLMKLHIVLERIVVLHPGFVIGLGLLCAGGAWVYLNNAERVRRHCSTPWVAFDEIFNRQKIGRSQRRRDAAPWKKLKDHPRRWVEGFFITRMTKSAPLGSVRFVWGGLYSSFAMLISQWKNAVSLALFFAAFLGYLGLRMAMMPALVLPLVVMGTYASQPMAYSALMIAGGRKERFFSTLVVVAAGAGLLALFIAAISLLSVPLAFVMPDFKFYGLNATYRMIGVKAIYAVLFYLPLASIVQLAFYRRPVLMTVALVMLVYSMAAVLFVFRRPTPGFTGGIQPSEPTSMLHTAILVIGVALCWLIFVVVLRHITTKRCLVK